MSNHPSEETLALYSAGDLEAGGLRCTGQHVDNCAECRASLAQLARLRERLAEVAAEPSAEDLREVRGRVLAALEHRKKRLTGFEAAAAAAALAIVALLSRHRAPAPEVRRAPASAATVHAPPMAAPRSAAVRKTPVVQRKRRLRAPGLRSVALVMRPGEAPTIQIATSDPKVIILLPHAIANDERTESNEE